MSEQKLQKNYYEQTTFSLKPYYKFLTVILFFFFNIPFKIINFLCGGFFFFHEWKFKVRNFVKSEDSSEVSFFLRKLFIFKRVSILQLLQSKKKAHILQEKHTHRWKKKTFFEQKRGLQKDYKKGIKKKVCYFCFLKKKKC